jgi:2-oxoisovalerate dehydrogenase E2 component (dihydrolipoyl transacylase)
MVKSMNDSLRVPQLNHADEIECGRLMEAIKALKPLAVSSFNLPTLTLTAFMIKAVSLGITEMPIINSRLAPSEDKVHILESHNVSVAMDSPRGLVVPNIKNVQDLSLVEIQKQLVELQERAKTGRLSLDNIRGGTVSFSNIGVIGGTYAKAIVFDGQAVIGAAGRVQTVPRFDELGNVVARRIVNVSWTADHRHVDGASVARFSNVFKDAVENPEKIIALHFR